MREFVLKFDSFSENWMRLKSNENRADGWMDGRVL